MKAKIFTLIFFGIMLVSVSRSYSQNLLTDGDFSSTTVITPYTEGVGPTNLWCTFQNTGTEANAEIVAGVCNYQVVNGGYDTWEVQLIQWGFSLTPGDYYRLTFDVRADAERWFGVYLGEDGGSWTSILGYENYWQHATTDWQTITLDFNAVNIFPYHKFSIEIGGYWTGMYFDNIMLVDLGLNPSVGIIGTAVNGWNVDVDMVTTDGITYTLTNYPLSLGAMKFRQNNTWSINWGSTDFPTGIGYADGPNIPVISASNYDITFNRITGDYSFVCVNNCHTAIGISGPAVPPYYSWDNDVKMMTSDGVTYLLPDQSFIDGEAKFRQDNNNDASWGGTAFPSGTATLAGPGIPVTAGSYNVAFNLSTGEYVFTFPSVGIIGTSLTGWTEDIDMQTTNGINYTLTEYSFTEGEVKFRQDNEWVVNWGEWAFPAGFGYQDGPNIPVLAGTYTVTFNRLSGEYFFTATSCPEPAIICPYYISEPTSQGLCGANVFYPDVVAAPNCGGEGVIITQIEGLPNGSFFPAGITTNTYVLVNPSGASVTCSFEVYVYDAEPPVMENLTVDPATIWPPDHKMVPVTVDYTAWDNCGSIIESGLWAWSSEPEDGSGDGSKSGDIELIDGHHVLLRAERSGTGTGREYHIYAYCWDEAWNFAAQEIIVTVPHDKSSVGLKPTIKSAEVLPLNVKIWPNPGDKYFNLDVESASDESIELYIYDTNGQLVSVLNVADKNSYRFGDELLPGIYLATVRQGGYFTTIKVVKK
jgi:hypothetical protein